jgi:hypothetical protein
MKRTICIIAAALALVMCKKEGPAGPAGPQGPAGPAGPGASPGSFAGKVRIYDQYGDSIQQLTNPPKISIKGKSITTNASATGNYTLSNVPAGVHTLMFEADGFGTMEIQEISFPGNDRMTVNQRIYQKPTFAITSATAYGAAQSIYGSGSIPFHTKPRAIMMIYGSNPAPDIDKPSSFTNFQLGYIPANSSNFNFYISNNANSVQYARIYPYNGLGFDAFYYDIATDGFVFPAHGAAYATTFTLNP